MTNKTARRNRVSLKKIGLIFSIVFLCLFGVRELFLFVENKKFIHQCELLALNWLHGRGLDKSEDVDFDVRIVGQTLNFYDLKNDGNKELVMTFRRNYFPKPGTNEQIPYDSSLIHLVFQKTDPILFENIFTTYLWDGRVLKDDQLLKSKNGLPNLFCVYDGMSDDPGGEPTGEIKGHVFILSGKTMKEVLVYNALNFVRQAPPGYNSKISIGEGRNLVVDYSIPVRSAKSGYNVISEKHKKVIFEWNEKLSKYTLQKGSPAYIETFINEN